MKEKSFRFVITIDIEAVNLADAYELLVNQMNDDKSPCHAWQSSDECYEDGELVDESVLQEAIDIVNESISIKNQNY